MLRKLLWILSALLLATASVTTAFWARSYWVSDFVAFTDAANSTSVRTVSGQLIWTRIEMQFPSPRGWEFGTKRGANAVRREDRIVNEDGLLKKNTFFYRYADVTPTNNAFRIKTAAISFWWWNLPLMLVSSASVLLCWRNQNRRRTGFAVAPVSEAHSANV